jgi:hypothetical protein
MTLRQLPPIARVPEIRLEHETGGQMEETSL